MDGLNTSIIGRAMDKGLLDIEAVNIRDYAFNKHNSVDDYPYGGGAGMLMQAEPVYQCYEAVKKKIETKALLSNPGTRKNPRVIYLSPQGKTFNQTMAEEFAQEEDLVFLCGHYEGIDERNLASTDHVNDEGLGKQALDKPTRLEEGFHVRPLALEHPPHHHVGGYIEYRTDRSNPNHESAQIA